MKKLVLLSVLAAAVAGGVFAQEKSANVKNNWISGELSLIGAGARYERMLGPKLSVGADAYWSSLFFFWNELEAGLFARFYPWGGTFFAEAGLGYHAHTAVGYDGAEIITGVALTPSLGWKIDTGKAGGFFIQPGIRLPITFGAKTATDGASVDTNKFGVGVGVVPYFGLGGAF
ncbi:MAG: hypothetical protein LBP37_01375 [Spirochaetaceae bacterium]|jgi:hypothetical protein|nr:hypothetical protein [Spirochaetaceae bacterium]